MSSWTARPTDPGNDPEPPPPDTHPYTSLPSPQQRPNLGNYVTATPGEFRDGRHSDRPARYEYLLTESGRDLGPVIVALYSWGIKHTHLYNRSVVLLDQDSGTEIEPVYIDRRSGKPLRDINAVFTAGPAATDQMRRRHDPDTKAALRDRAPCRPRAGRLGMTSHAECHTDTAHATP